MSALSDELAKSEEIAHMEPETIPEAVIVDLLDQYKTVIAHQLAYERAEKLEEADAYGRICGGYEEVADTYGFRDRLNKVGQEMIYRVAEAFRGETASRSALKDTGGE